MKTRDQRTSCSDDDIGLTKRRRTPDPLRNVGLTHSGRTPDPLRSVGFTKSGRTPDPLRSARHGDGGQCAPYGRLSDSLAPVLRGEGWGEGTNALTCKRRHIASRRPLTLPSPLSTGERVLSAPLRQQSRAGFIPPIRSTGDGRTPDPLPSDDRLPSEGGRESFHRPRVGRALPAAVVEGMR
jgi:hypothetical protein